MLTQLLEKKIEQNTQKAHKFARSPLSPDEEKIREGFCE